MATFMEGASLYEYKFIFKMDGDMPPEVQRKWNRLCRADLYNETPVAKRLIARWGHRFGRELEPLDRSEGGIGGDNNLTDRQIRFVPMDRRDIFPAEKEITFWVQPLSPDDGTNPWTLIDLLPYLTALRHALADLTTEGTGAVKCYISCDTRLLGLNSC